MSQEVVLEDVAKQYEEVASELKVAIAHLNDVSMHFRNKDLARAGAHAFSVYGHMQKAEALFVSLAKLHADKSTPHQPLT